MACLGFGVWSLAGFVVLRAIITSFLLWQKSSWRPSFLFKRKSIKSLLGFSSSLFGTQVLNYSKRNFDKLLIGRFLGTSALGIYDRAYSIMMFPLVSISRIITNVLFPALSLIRGDDQRTRNIYLRTTRGVAFFTFPMMLGLFVVSDSFVYAVLGQKWAGMIPILRIFCFLGLISSVLTFNGSLYLSQGRADLQFKVGLFLKLNTIFWIILGLKWGIIGVAIGCSIAALFNFYPSFFFAGRLVNLSFLAFLRNFSGVFLCSFVMALLVWGISLVLPASWPQWVFLAVQVPFGMLVYAAAVHLSGVDAYLDIRRLLYEQWKLRTREKNEYKAKKGDGYNVLRNDEREKRCVGSP